MIARDCDVSLYPGPVSNVSGPSRSPLHCLSMESSDARRLSAFTKGRQTSVDRTIDSDKGIAAFDRNVVERLQRAGALV
jgi:hypothetical protein